MKTIRENERRFTGTIEELILRTGLGVVIVWLASCLVTARYAPDVCTGIFKQTGFHAMGGRLAGITSGLTTGLPGWLVVAVAFAADMTVVCLLYPVIIYSYERGARRWFMRGTIGSTVEAARSGRKKVRRWGIVGIVFFVWFPFYTTGPLIGAIIGYFLRLRAWVTLVSVGIGTLLAIVSWTALSDPLLSWLEEVAKGFTAYVPWIIVVLVLVGFAAAWILRRMKRSAATRKPPSEDPEESEEKSDAA